MPNRASLTVVAALACGLSGCVIAKHLVKSMVPPTPAVAATEVRASLARGIVAAGDGVESIDIDDDRIRSNSALRQLLTARRWLTVDRSGTHLNLPARDSSSACLGDSPGCRTFVLGHLTLAELDSATGVRIVTEGDALNGLDTVYAYRVTLRTHAETEFAREVANARALVCLDRRGVSQEWHGSADFTADAYFTGDRPGFSGLDYTCPNLPGEDRRGGPPFVGTIYMH